MRIDKSAEFGKEYGADAYSLYKKLINARASVAGLIAGMFVLSSTVTFAAPNEMDIKIVDDSQSTTVSTRYSNVGEVLAEQGIKLGEYDVVTPSADDIIDNSRVIVIERVNKIVVNDGGTSEYYSKAATYGQFFKENSIVLNESDAVNVDLNAKPQNGDVVQISRVTKLIQTVEENIPYKTVEVADNTRLAGSKYETGGINGKRVVEVEVTTRDGEVISTKEVSSNITKKPVDKTIYVGTNNSNPSNINYKRVIKCSATAYDLSYASCGKRPGDKGYGITATGTRASYGTVAVDPSVIPLGSKLYIESSDGSFVYGYSVAADTGGAIKGNKVDLFFDSYSACMSFGRRTVNVYILN